MPLRPADPSLFALVIAGRERLVRAGLPLDSAAIDAEVLAREALGWDRTRYVQQRADPPPDGFTARFDALVDRRERREPVSQILGRREFWGREFRVTRDVLTPRPETELVIEAALERWPAGSDGPARAADAGTGSGCLAVTLACEWPRARLLATDISAAALSVAVDNCRRHHVSSRVQLLRADLVGPLDDLTLIVSNPPYVPEAARGVLPPDVREFEPDEALFGGPSGFDLIERLLDQAASRLTAGGLLIMEFGAGQDDRVDARVARRPRLRLVEIREDLQGIPRVAVIERRA